jgi:hypothetical protein
VNQPVESGATAHPVAEGVDDGALLTTGEMARR